MAMAITIAMLAGLAAWESNKVANRYRRKMVALMEHMDSLGMGQQAIEVARKS